MISAQEPFHPSVSSEVTAFGLARNWGYGLVVPGLALGFLGLITLRVGLILGGIVLCLLLVVPARIASGENPNFLGDLFGHAIDWFLSPRLRYLVPEPGLRGQDGL